MRLDVPDYSDDWIQPNEMVFPVLLENVEDLQDILDLNPDYMDDLLNTVPISDNSGVDYEDADSECVNLSRSVSEDSLSESSSDDEVSPPFYSGPIYCDKVFVDLPSPIHSPDEEEGPSHSFEGSVPTSSKLPDYNNLFSNESSIDDSADDWLSVISPDELYSPSPLNPPCSPVSENDNPEEFYSIQNAISDSSHNFEAVPSVNDHGSCENTVPSASISLENSGQLLTLPVADSFMEFDQSCSPVSESNRDILSVTTALTENLNKTQELGVQSVKSVSNLKRKSDPVNDDVVNKLPKLIAHNDSDGASDSCESYCKTFSGCSSEQPTRGDKTDAKQSSVCVGNMIVDKSGGNNSEEKNKSKS